MVRVPLILPLAMNEGYFAGSLKGSLLSNGEFTPVCHHRMPVAWTSVGVASGRYSCWFIDLSL